MKTITLTSLADGNSCGDADSQGLRHADGGRFEIFRSCRSLPYVFFLCSMQKWDAMVFCENNIVEVKPRKRVDLTSRNTHFAKHYNGLPGGSNLRVTPMMAMMTEHVAINPFRITTGKTLQEPEMT